MPPFKSFGKSGKKSKADKRNAAIGRSKRKYFRHSCIQDDVEQHTSTASCSNVDDASNIGNDLDLHSHITTGSLNISSDNKEISEEIYRNKVEGRRIVEFSYVFEQLQDIGSHSSLHNCNLKCVHIVKEQKSSLYSTFKLKCSMCGKEFDLQTSQNSNQQMDINEEAVSGIMSTGAGYTQLNTVLCSINVPPMSLRIYQSTHDKVCQWWETAAKHSMSEAGKKEKEHALSIGNTNKDGTPMIPVTGDACWSKRSYGSNYCASSGVAALVGIHSKKVIFYGIRNKVCRICSVAHKKVIAPSQHECFKNFDGPATAMEASIITEGFKRSEQDHGLIYNQYVADGDSSTYASIRNSRPYQSVTVGKLECTNHLLRNYCKSLLSIANNTTHPIKARKLLKEHYLRIRWGVESSVKYWTKQQIPFPEKMENIRNDIINGPYHIFGDHSKCATYFCNDEMKKRNDDIVPELMMSGVFQKVDDLARRLAFHSYSFVYNQTNNLVESFNARVAKLVGGKRVNFSQRRSYGGRCAAAVISYNTGVLQTYVHKLIFGNEANAQIVRLEWSRQQRNINRIKKQTKKSKKNRHSNAKQDSHYGEGCQKVDLDESKYNIARDLFLQKLDISSNEKHQIEVNTILQSACPLWLETRRKLLTASWFGSVCKRRPNTNCAPLVKQILYGKDLSNIPSIKHGRQNEHTALRELETVLNTKIYECGLTIDEEFSFLGASPDGKCELGIIEIKCPSSAFGIDPEDAIKQKKVDFWKFSNETFSINKSHKWFYQIQGQLHITGQKNCIFAIWTGPGKIKFEMIPKDDHFWKENMEANLVRFYKNCLLPELVDPRFSRNMDLRAHESHIRNTNILKNKN